MGTSAALLTARPGEATTSRRCGAILSVAVQNDDDVRTAAGRPPTVPLPARRR